MTSRPLPLLLLLLLLLAGPLSALSHAPSPDFVQPEIVESFGEGAAAPHDHVEREPEPDADALLEVQAGEGEGINFYYDASNMPSWLTPPWVTPGFRTGPLAMPLPQHRSLKAGPMYAGFPTQPILPFDSALPTDNLPISTRFANYPTATIPSGRELTPGQSPPLSANEGGSFLELAETIQRNPPPGHAEAWQAQHAQRRVPSFLPPAPVHVGAYQPYYYHMHYHPYRGYYPE